MWKKIGIALVVIVVALLGVIAVQPADYSVTRRVQISAPPEKLFVYINDLHNWDAWSPWTKLDPNLKFDFTGAPSGVGSIYHWVGNDQIGEGRMTITAAQPSDRIDIKLQFIKPFESDSMVSFLITPDSGGSSVAWQMTGTSNFMEKAVCLFMGGMDKMIGPDFERGLAQLKVVAEKP